MSALTGFFLPKSLTTKNKQIMEKREIRSRKTAALKVERKKPSMSEEVARLCAIVVELTRRVEELTRRVEVLEGTRRLRLEKPTKCELPERAWELLEKARDGGLLDEDMRPKCSLTMLALLANIISYEVWGERRWKPFEELWSVKQLQSYYQRALSLYKFERLNEKIIATLSPLVPNCFL